MNTQLTMFLFKRYTFGRVSLLAAILLVSLLLASIALAAPQSYNIAWCTVDSGGQTSSNGVYTLSGTIGQPDIGEMSNGGYTLVGGFWPGKAAASQYRLYLPLVRK